ncbi:MAG: tripartite tricarboxylate transporter substrate binding protein [Rubrivivax sp.]|nr:tripartite tricarboxylate transporter substrate binding protein [Rubrivivax sp.]
MTSTLRRAGVACGLLLAAGLAPAQDAYPNRTIRWFVPFLAGTAPDTTVRIVADAMALELKQNIVVENKPGVAGNLGAQAAARAPADGYTWVYSSSPMAAAMRMHRKPGFDVMKDFVHIGRIAYSDLTVVAPVDAGTPTLQALLDKARRQPGKLMFASGGIGSPAHMGGELMLATAGADATHVPFKGATESVNAVVGRQVGFALAISSVALLQVQSGKVLPLAVTGPQRNPKLPQVPTLQEAGVAMTLQSFGGLSVPAGTPAPVVARIGDALAKVLAQPEVRAKLEANGGLAAPSTPEQYTEQLRAEIGLAERLMKAARLEPN